MSNETAPILTVVKGPFVYENWLSKLANIPTPATYEYPMYTDAHITGEVISGLGPYKLLNGLEFREDNLIRPGIVLRVDIPNQEQDLDLIWNTDASGYHGGGLKDEIAALVSLSLGIRLKSDEATREFIEGGDPRGRPMGYLGGPSPTLIRRHGGNRFILPGAIGIHCLNDMILLPKLPLLQPSDALSLVISARSYQNAMWIAEAEPELAWLLMVSAIETAATHWSVGTDPVSERLKASKPELYNLLLTQGGEELVEQVATIIAPSLGVTSKFIRFMMAHLPDPPSERPPDFCQLNWTPAAMKRVLSKVYNYRSVALHTGRPFPAPMCEYPSYRGDTLSFNETMLGLAAHTMGATWQREDVPMLLHVFEYITRNVLLKWWASMLPNDSTTAESVNTDEV